MVYSSVETFFFATPVGPVTTRLTILQEISEGQASSSLLVAGVAPTPVPHQLWSYLPYWALDLTVMVKVWLTKAGRIAP